MKPLFPGFLATNVWIAFGLNSIAAAIAVVAGVFLKDFWDRRNNKNHQRISSEQMVVTFLFTIVASFVAYTVLHFAFGFGGGMLVE